MNTALDGTTNNSQTYVSTQLPINAIQLDAGYAHACIVDGNHFTWCWGVADDGRALDGNDGPRLIPARGMLEDIQKVSAGGEHTCAVTTGGGLKCWGVNTDGQLGNNTTTKSKVPVDVLGL